MAYFNTILNVEAHGSFCTDDSQTDDTVADDASATADEVFSYKNDEEPPPTPGTPEFDSTVDVSAMQPLTKSRCTFDATCELLSPDRKVTSHYFGRNKKETRGIPEECWVLYCRQHYQRVRYRASDSEFAQIQMGLVRSTVQNLQKWGGVQDFNLSLRKRVMDRIKHEDERKEAVRLALLKNGPLPERIAKEEECRERWLLQYIGNHVSYDHVYEFLDIVANYCKSQGCNALEFEIVPNFKEVATKKSYPVRRTSKDKPGRSSRITKPTRCGSDTASQVRHKMLTTRPQSSRKASMSNTKD